MAMIGVGLFVVDRYLIEQAPPPTIDAPARISGALPVIAVLPFEVIGSEDAGTLASGLHHDLLTRMSKLRVFSVISRTSMLDYADTTKNMRQIGQELGAGYIIEGGVQLVGDRVRINAQLIDATLDEHLWAETYDHELTATDLFQIQAELAVAIAEQLELALAESDRGLIAVRPTESTEAYAAYLRGLAVDADLNIPDHEAAPATYAAMREALSYDPEFVQAWLAIVELSSVAIVAWDTREGAFAAINEALAEVRRLAPGSYEETLAEVYDQYYLQRNYDAALLAIEELERRGPIGTEGLRMKAYALRRDGRLEEAFQVLLQASRLDPRSLDPLGAQVYMAIWLRDCAAAGRSAAAALALAPDALYPRSWAAHYELQCNADGARAMELIEEWIGIDDGVLWLARLAAGIQRDYDRVLELLSMQEEHAFWWGDPLVDRAVRAGVLRIIGRDEEAHALLDSVQEEVDQHGPSSYEGLESDYAQLRVRIAAARGDHEAVRIWVGELSALMGDPEEADLLSRNNYYRELAFTYAEAGMVDEAVDSLERFYETPNDMTFRFVEAHPVFDSIRDHPGYAELRARYGED
jgi:TolB-like protein